MKTITNNEAACPEATSSWEVQEPLTPHPEFDSPSPDKAMPTGQQMQCLHGDGQLSFSVRNWPMRGPTI